MGNTLLFGWILQLVKYINIYVAKQENLEEMLLVSNSWTNNNIDAFISIKKGKRDINEVSIAQ